MGCLFHKSKSTKLSSDNIQKKEYSWDKRDNINIDDFTIENLENFEKWKLPGSVNGQQLIIQNCQNSTIYALDHMNTVTIDDCVGCKLILGPVKGSTFLRNCKDCVCLVASGQFRLRDCRNLVIFLYCTTQPIIESSSSIYFGCYQLFYFGIKEHFERALLSIFNNSWSKIHDFTPTDGESNWFILPENTTPFQYIPNSQAFGDSGLGLSLSLIDSVVPYTTFTEISDETEYCFIVFFFNKGKEETSAATIINKIYTEMVNCRLIWSKQIQLENQDAQEIFLTDSYSNIIKKGPLIGLLFSGPYINNFCREKTESECLNNLVYISSDPVAVRKQIQAFLTITYIHVAF